jgi:hypothetical protein
MRVLLKGSRAPRAWSATTDALRSSPDNTRADRSRGKTRPMLRRPCPNSRPARCASTPAPHGAIRRLPSKSARARHGRRPRRQFDIRGGLPSGQPREQERRSGRHSDPRVEIGFWRHASDPPLVKRFIAGAGRRTRRRARRAWPEWRSKRCRSLLHERKCHDLSCRVACLWLRRQPGAALECQVREHPAQRDDEAIAHSNEEVDVRQAPHQPAGEPGELH